MNALTATLYNAGIVSFGEGKAVQAALCFWTIARLAGADVAKDLIDRFRSQLLIEFEQAVSAQDSARSLLLDSLNAIFDEAAAARLGQSMARRRAAHCVDLARSALREKRLEEMLIFSLAALALDPGASDAERLLAGATQDLVERCLTLDPAAPSLEGTLLLAAGAALGAAEPRRLLLDVLDGFGDFNSVIQLCAQIESDERAKFEDRFQAVRRRWIAQHRLDGAESSAAESLADKEAKDWLVALGPAAGLEDAALAERVMRCFAHGGYRRTLSDLQELLRRDPENEWAAFNRCVILFNALHPDVAAVVDLIVRRMGDDVDAIRDAHTMMSMMGATPQALALAEQLAAHHPEYAMIGPLHQMATDLDAPPAHVFGRARLGRRLLYANLVCWGSAYIDLMEQASIASLLAPGNIPALVETVDLVVELFTMPADLPRLLASAALRRLSEHCEIRLHAFPAAVAATSRDWGYAIYGHALHATALRAERDGADITFLLPDLIYADGDYARIAQEVTSEPRAVFVDGLNALARPMLERMEPHRRDDVLAIPAPALIEAMTRCLSRRTLHSIYSPGDGRTCLEPTRVIFPTASGLRTHGFMMLPVYVSHAALAPILMKNFRTPDGLFLEHVLNKVTDDQLKVLSGLEFCYAEISDGDGFHYPMADITLTESIRKFFTNFGMGRNRLRLFLRPIDYPMASSPDFPLVSAEETAARVRDIQEMFATDPVMVDLAEEQERVRLAFYR